MVKTKASEPWEMDDVGRDRSGIGPDERWRRWVAIGVAGAVYWAALDFALASEGGRDAALFYGTLGFAFSFPVLLLAGKLMATILNKIKALGNAARVVVTIAPTLLLSGPLVYEGYRSQDPVAKFERWIVSPAPPSVRVVSAYTYQGFNYQIWAFHFTVAPEDRAKVLARRPYHHEVDPAGVYLDLEQARDRGARRPGYPVPPLGFKAVHRYRSHTPTSRAGSGATLYADASQTEFFAYGYVE